MMPSQIYFALLTDGGIHLTIFFICVGLYMVHLLLDLG